MRETEIKDDLIRVRVTPKEKRFLVEAARKRGLSISEFLRSTAHRAAALAA